MAQPEQIPAADADNHAFQAAVEQGMASLDAGRSVPYEDIRKWLLSWGTDKELPAPECR